MVGSIFATIVLGIVLSMYLYVQFRKMVDHPPYDGSAVVGDVPDYQPPVVRNERGQFAKGNQPPNVRRGQGGKFVSAKATA